LAAKDNKRMKVAEYIVARLQRLGVDTCFLVTGGGAMHLNDALGGAEGMRKVCCHHEQSAGIAAEAYARLQHKPALVNVTTGPGCINALNGVFGAFTDSVPMIVVSGQVKRETLRECSPILGLRQLGDQEVDIISMVRPITKWASLLRTELEVADAIDEAFLVATSGRPGPVWLDVPVDVQGMRLPDSFAERLLQPLPTAPAAPQAPESTLAQIIQQLAEARRPVILVGTGIGVSGTEAELLRLAEALQVPVSTAWAHDVFPNQHPLYVGRPGTIGTRDGNFVLQNADLVLVLGSRLNIRQTSYNWSSFARSARKIWVDIDAAELAKPFVTAETKVQADLRTFLPAMLLAVASSGWKPHHQAWLAWCHEIRAKYRPKVADYSMSANRINPYHFFIALFEHVRDNDIVACGNATATIIPFQVGRLRDGMRLLSNSGSASMGYDIPAALGAAVAQPGARILCLAGDGSSMMNLQELQTLRATGANIKVFILNNDGYLSIKQSQKNFFGRETGASSTSGLSFPDFLDVGRTFGFKSVRLEGPDWQTTMASAMAEPGPTLFDVSLELSQEFEPRLKSRMVDGVIKTPELEDMYPFLPEAEILAVRQSAQNI
jgi:acetolactate synthase I/II/III large subunit